MQKIVPFLWFEHEAEEAMEFYISVFKDGRVLNKTYYGEAGPGKKGELMTAGFLLHGQEYRVLNGGPLYQFTPAISFVVNCQTQEEVDELWEKLTAAGEKSRCGWLKDKYGLSWQIIPVRLGELLGDKDPAKSGKVMQAMLQMDKIDIHVLQQAYDRA